MTEPTLDSSSEQTWETSQYEEALAHLERLQEQLDKLRPTIPTLVDPLAQPAKSKAQMFGNIKKSASDSTDEIRVLRETWMAERTRELFARSKESLEKDGDLTKAKDVPRYGWSEG